MLRAILLFLGLACVFMDEVSGQLQSGDPMDFLSLDFNAQVLLTDTAIPNRMRKYKHYKRWEMTNAARVDAQGRPFNFAAKNFSEYQKLKKEMAAHAKPEMRVTHGHWASVMPTEYSPNEPFNGRVNVLAVHPNNENILFAGTAFGGLWKSTNAGGTWTCLTDALPVTAISGIAIHPMNPNVIYILTGDGDGRIVPSIGILKSTDGGATWRKTDFSVNITYGLYPYKLLMNPVHPDTMYIAASTGLYLTYDGWETSWTASHQSWRDIEFKPDDLSVLYACTWNAVYRSTNHGVHWTNLSLDDPVLPETDTGMTRIALTVSPDNPQWVYALHAWDDSPDGDAFIGLYGSSNGGNSWTMLSDTPNITGNQTGYDLTLIADPENVTRVFVGGVKFYESDNIVVDDPWEDLGTGFIHADVHDILITNSHIYIATDGGVARSDDDGTTWIDITNGMNIAQIYDFDVHGNRTIEGSQDNGTMLWTHGDTEADHVIGGDGFECMFHPSDPQVMYGCTQEARARSLDGGNSWQNITPPGDSAIWDASWIMHPTNPDTLYSGWRTIWRTYDGGNTWFDLEPGFSGQHTVRAMTQGVSNPNRLYASDRHSFKRTSTLHSNQPSWVDVTVLLPDSMPIGAIAVDPANSSRVWVTYQGYDTIKVVYSSDSGDSWTDISGSLPPVPVNCIIYQAGSNDGLYIGTDIGVFYRNAALSDWIYFANGLPVTRVEDFQISGGYLYAATYGRGVWRSLLYTTCPLSYALTPANDPSNPLSTGVQHYEASFSIASTRKITGGIGTDVLYQAGNYVRLDPGFEAKAWSEFQAVIDGCAQ